MLCLARDGTRQSSEESEGAASERMAGQLKEGQSKDRTSCARAKEVETQSKGDRQAESVRIERGKGRRRARAWPAGAARPSPAA
eukprot:26152-Pleurochrysis_carterae.AAC.3